MKRIHKAHLLSLLKNLLETPSAQYLEGLVMLTELETWNLTLLVNQEVLGEDPQGCHPGL